MATALKSGELSTLTGHELSTLFNDIDRDAAALLAEATEYEEKLAKAETRLVYDPTNKEAKAERILQRALLRAANRKASAIRLRQSRIQSLMKLCKI